MKSVVEENNFYTQKKSRKESFYVTKKIIIFYVRLKRKMGIVEDLATAYSIWYIAIIFSLIIYTLDVSHRHAKIVYPHPPHGFLAY